MAKIRTYIRIAKTSKGYKAVAGTKSNNEPVVQQDYRGKQFFPTVSFAVDFNVPDELFNQASRVIGEINIAMKNAEVAAEVQVPTLKDTDKKGKQAPNP